MKLRPARLQDASLLLAWRNDPLTRRFSRNTAMISEHEHLLWLRDTLADPARRLYIAEVKGVPVGTVRADFDGCVYELSWTVAPEVRGRKVGKRMVQLLLQELDGPVRAQIKSMNAASIRTAEAAGMRLSGERDGMLQYQRP